MPDSTPGVVLSWIFPEQVSGWFAYSVASMLYVDSQTNRYICGETGDVITVSSGPRVAEARNQLVDNFATQTPKAEWLLMIDSDMTFGPTLLNDLMSSAHPEERPIVGGLCFAGGKQNDPYPTIYAGIICKDDEGNEYPNVERVDDYPRNALVKVQATGGACLLIHRGVFAAMKEAYGSLQNGKPNIYPWFQEGVLGPNGEAWGEDINFCLRAGALGIPVHVDTRVKLGHVKTHLIDEVYFDNRRRAKELTDEGAFDAQQPRQPQQAGTGPVGLVGAADSDGDATEGVPNHNRAQRRAAARRRQGAAV